MSTATQQVDFSALIAEALPYLRRYARALTGSQKTGDNYAVATLEAILADRSIADEANSPKVGLFKCFHAIWTSSGAPVDRETSDILTRAQGLLDNLTPNSREALLLYTIENFSFSDVSEILEIDTALAKNLLQVAQDEMTNSVTGKVLIIEDEAIIAADLSGIVEDQGHTVTGMARTRDEAFKAGAKERPDLILADIQLADNSSGIDAVNDLLSLFGNVPVIFITAFPERLLTGDKPEPAFLISKPYKEEQVRSAVSQAMFFASTETLKG